MVIQMIIDSRENALVTILRTDYQHIPFMTQSLDVGDIMFKIDEQVACLIERKTLEDYANSITDKRLYNQAIRIKQLKTQFPDMGVIYVIEGKMTPDFKKFRNGITRDALHTSLIHRIIKDHFSIFFTNDINDTISMIIKILDKIEPVIAPIGAVTTNDPTIEYLKTIKLAKKDNMTPYNCYMCQLSQIPGISVEIADIIGKQYPSICGLIMAYQKLSGIQDKLDMLSEISIPIANNRTKRLGTVLSERIYHFLHDQPLQPKMKIELKHK